jgi:hypothetical protein
MRMKANDNITTNKEANMSDHAYEEEEEPQPAYISLSL